MPRRCLHEYCSLSLSLSLSLSPPFLCLSPQLSLDWWLSVNCKNRRKPFGASVVCVFVCHVHKHHEKKGETVTMRTSQAALIARVPHLCESVFEHSCCETACGHTTTASESPQTVRVALLLFPHAPPPPRTAISLPISPEFSRFVAEVKTHQTHLVVARL